MKCYFTKHLLNIIARIPILLMAIVLASCLLLSSQASGQGLLGRRYSAIGYEMDRPKSSPLKKYSEWAYTANFTTNYPINSRMDLKFDFSTGWFGGNHNFEGTPINLDMDFSDFRIRLNNYFYPEETINPFVGIGLGYTKFNLSISSGSTGVFRDDDDLVVDYVFGLEWKPNDRIAIRPMVSSDSSLENFNTGSIDSENIYIENQFIYWWNESWFSGFSVGSDFNDTQVGLGFYLGYGAW